MAVRAAAAALLDSTSRIALIRAGTDGGIELTLTADAALPPPWQGAGRIWSLPGQSPVELLADAARTVGAPCVALTQLGLDDDGAEVLADLEALGVLGIDAPAPLADAVVLGIAATLATSVFAEPADLVGVGIDATALLDHRHAHVVESVDSALELAATLVGTTAAAPHSTFVLRARHTSGEAWEPAIVLVGSEAAGDLDADLVRSIARSRAGVAVVVAGDAPGAPWSLRVGDGAWVLEPAGVVLTPVGLSSGDVAELQGVLRDAAAPLVDEVGEVGVVAGSRAGDPEVPWTLMVRLIGPVAVVDAAGRPAVFERSKALELIAWLALHRDRSTRAGARTALWELDVRDATFANVVSEARRSMARLAEPPAGEEWLGRTMTDVLPLHPLVVSDVDLVRSRLDVARVQPPEQAIDTLRPAVELIRDLPFAATGYLWPDAEGITSNLVLLATSAATELAGHFLSMGDIEGVFWATGQGLKVLPGHEELIALPHARPRSRRRPVRRAPRVGVLRAGPRRRSVGRRRTSPQAGPPPSPAALVVTSTHRCVCWYTMVRTNVELDNDLVAEAMRRYGLPTKRAAIDYALRRLVGEAATREEALALEGSGWDADLDELRTGRSALIT